MSRNLAKYKKHSLKAFLALLFFFLICQPVISYAKQDDGFVVEKGRIYYYMNGEPATDWLKIGGKWYYFDTDGVMQTGWMEEDGKWYYLNADGVMQTGWKKLSKKWYYFAADGAMQTGWISWGDEWYYLNADGAMHTGWVSWKHKWYYLGTDGIMQTGWKEIENDWYFLEASGAMKTGWKKYSGGWYYLASTGAMVIDWNLISGKAYLFDKNGALVIDGVVVGEDTAMPAVNAKTFLYARDPKENPSVMKDAVVNPDAVFGFSPNPESTRLGAYADAIDWTDPVQVAAARKERADYFESLSELYTMIETMQGEGKSTEEIARAVSKRRNELRLEAYKDDPEGLAEVKKSNLETYGHEEGPQADDLYAKYGSWQTVMDKALSTNSGMDACLGFYDELYYVYGLED